MINQSLRVLAAVLVISTITNSAQAYIELDKKGGGGGAYTGRGDQAQSVNNAPADDSQIVSANKGRQQVFFVSGANLEVIKILPDDTQGLPHQKWVGRCSDGSTVLIVYNSDMGSRVPVQIGDKFSVGGQYIWTPAGGLVHWTHYDPKHIRPDGFVLLNGTAYGAR